jgi:hypothetical protein
VNRKLKEGLMRGGGERKTAWRRGNLVQWFLSEMWEIWSFVIGWKRELIAGGGAEAGETEQEEREEQTQRQTETVRDGDKMIVEDGARSPGGRVVLIVIVERSPSRAREGVNEGRVRRFMFGLLRCLHRRRRQSLCLRGVRTVLSLESGPTCADAKLSNPALDLRDRDGEEATVSWLTAMGVERLLFFPWGAVLLFVQKQLQRRKKKRRKEIKAREGTP